MTGLAWNNVVQEQLQLVAEAREEIRLRWLQTVLEERRVQWIVLDDDPTGSQTVHSVPVYTSWDDAAVEELLKEESRVVYLLTNSRALPAHETKALHLSIAESIRAASARLNKPYLLISRGDSTLRGHYPLETETLRQALEPSGDVDGEVLIPAFFEGGRLTVNDVHYVLEGEKLIPAGETEFARDSTFGYRSSSLKEWIEEKSQGLIRSEKVASIPLELLRRRDIPAVVERLSGMSGFSKIIVNALDYTDLRVFYIALNEALRMGKTFLFRTAASFVQVAAGQEARPQLTHRELYPDSLENRPGLIVAGSYTGKTTQQLQHLKELAGMEWVEWDVSHTAASDSLDEQVRSVAEQVSSALAAGQDVCLFTSRAYLSSGEAAREAHLRFSVKVSEGLVRVVQELKEAPGFLVAKGGITSSDIGVKGLGVRRALVLGQAAPGVPVWRLGPESRFPGLPYVIFPGNVGQEDALLQVVNGLRGRL